MYKLVLTEPFLNRFKKISSRNNNLKQKIYKTLRRLIVDPYYPSLRSHKVQTRKHGIRWSSRITGDNRVIWDYLENKKLVIIILDIGGHSGKGRVYKNK